MSILICWLKSAVNLQAIQYHCSHSLCAIDILVFLVIVPLKLFALSGNVDPQTAIPTDGTSTEDGETDEIGRL
jgi:hypothetical protein